MRFADLPQLLHASIPRFSPEQRREEIATYRRKITHHFIW